MTYLTFLHSLGAKTLSFITTIENWEGKVGLSDFHLPITTSNIPRSFLGLNRMCLKNSDIKRTL